MEDKLRAYMDDLFRDRKPDQASIELKEEILQNLVDKYHDLLEEGKTPEAAYNIVVASVGDMRALLDDLNKERGGLKQMDEKMEKARRKSAGLTAAAVMLYIVSVLPPILIQGRRQEDLAPALMFLIIAAATGLIIYATMTKPRYQKRDDSMVEDFKEWKAQNDTSRRTRRAISSALWCMITAIYIVVSFWTGAWYVTWVIFLIGLAIDGIIRAIFEWKGQGMR